ncbi:ankyrin [Lentithecium fluviatile CBS 122367]|uniref:Ankyrin n=1 Tax=Lentithecium fluviatile CBS 122367 TaxID=1168545 RepID=A0A6G1J9L1_9PLEO|nr:ankyrin [Lentithecium fluviatile CBS 122367]
MADPLSVAGSIAGLISLGDVVFRKLYNYTREAKHAEKSINDLRNEIATLNGVLHNLRLVAEDLEAMSNLNHSLKPDHVKSCMATVQKLHDKLENLGLSNSGKLRGAVQKLAWPFKSINVNEFIEDVRQHRNNLSFALSADSMTALLKCLSLQESSSQKLDDIDARLENKERIDTRIAVDDERQRILDHFLSVDPQPSFNTNVKLRYPTTGFWLKENDIFSKWIRETGTNLWLSGIAGAGKSVLAGLVIEECMNRMTAERAVAFYYCDYKDPKSHPVTTILCTIASQIARQNERSFQLLKDYFSDLHPPHQLKRTPELSELISLIRAMSTKFEDVRIVVDGLDECGDDVGEISNGLVSLVAEGTNISLALFSRDEADIREALAHPRFAPIEIAAQTRDLDHYVRSDMEQRINNKRLRLKSVELKEEIVKQLVSKAQGMFRWVSCQLDHLCELPTDKERRSALDKLPVTLHGTYDRLLMRIKEPTMVSLVQRSLQWLAYASPTLSLTELVEILSVGEGDTSIDPEGYPDPEDVIRSCGSLVRRAGASLELAHFTVLQFLEAIDMTNDRLSKFCLTPNDKLKLVRTGVRYLCFSSFDQTPPTTLAAFWKQRKAHKFHGYIARYLRYYLDSDWDDAELLEHLQSLFDPKKTFNFTYFMLQYLCEYRVTQLSSRSRKFDRNEFDHIIGLVCSQDFTPLHAAGMLHLDKVCQWLLNRGCDVNQVSPAGTPLECALFGTEFIIDGIDTFAKHLFRPKPQQTISLLLAAGADCRKCTREGVSLSYVAVCGPTDSASPLAELLKYGMPIDADVVEYLEDSDLNFDESFFKLLDETENDKIAPEVKVKLLSLARAKDLVTNLDLPAAKTVTDEAFLEAIEFAIEFDLLTQFQEYARDPRFTTNMQNSQKSGTLLHLATECRAVQVTNHLLNLRYDPAESDEKGRVALQKAIASGGFEDDSLIHRLATIEAVNQIDGGGRSLWHSAARFGSYRTLQVLLDQHGATSPGLCASSLRGHTPLLRALLYRHFTCAKLILEALIAAKCPLSLDWRLCHYAASLGLLDFLICLADSGFDIRLLSKEKRTALFYLTSETPLEVVNYLLEKGLDPGHYDPTGKTALHAFLARTAVLEHDEDLRILRKHTGHLQTDVFEKLATVSSVSSKDNDGLTPWYHFCHNTVPFVLNSTSEGKVKYINDLFSILERHGAHATYDQDCTGSSLALFIEICLDWEGDLDSPSSDEIAAVAAALLHALCKTDSTMPDGDHPQLIRLLVWASQNSQHSLIDRLLDYGVCVHAPSHYHDGFSAIETMDIPEVRSEVLAKLLDRAEVARLADKNRYGSTLLHELCAAPTSGTRKIAIPKIQTILEKGLDVDVLTADSARQAPVHIAAKNGFIEAIKLLDSFQADLYVLDGNGWGMIPYAVRSNHLDLVRWLRKRLPEQQQWTRSFTITSSSGMFFSGCNLLHLAAAFGHMDMFEELKETGFFSDMNARDETGGTPLHFAACCQRVEAVRWLIDHGIDTNAKAGPDKDTALHRAMRHGFLLNALALVQAGALFMKNALEETPDMIAHPDIRTELIELLPHCGVTLPPSVLENLKQDPKSLSTHDLCGAIETGDLEVCRAFVESGQSLATSVEERGYCTPLIVALASLKYEIVDLFLIQRAYTGGFPCKRHSGWWPLLGSSLDIAIGVNSPKINSRLRLLLEISLEHQSHWIHSTTHPLHIAAGFNPKAIDILMQHVQVHEDRLWEILSQKSSKRSHSTLTELLLERQWTRNPSYNFSDGRFEFGGTALHLAALQEHSDGVEKLLFYGANAHALDEGGRTPLHNAFASGCFDSAQLLLKHGARKLALDSNLRTPLMLACFAGTVKTFLSLADLDQEVGMADSDGMTALHLSTQQSDVRVFIQLIEVGWDPYQKDISGRTPIFYGLQRPRFATYIYAAHLDLAHLAPDDPPTVGPGLRALKQCYRALPEQVRAHYTSQEPRKIHYPLCAAASAGNVQVMEVLLRAGANMELPSRASGTALVTACLTGQLSSAKYLVRRGASYDSTFNGRPINALDAAHGHQAIIEWFLVGRFTDQLKLTSGDADNNSTQKRVMCWSGVRQMRVLLRAEFDRPTGWSSLQLATHWRRRKVHWPSMVPPNWDPVAHFTPTIEELRAAYSAPRRRNTTNKP